MTIQTTSQFELRQELHRLIDLLPSERIVYLYKLIVRQPIQQFPPEDSLLENGVNHYHQPGLPRLVLQPAASLEIFTSTLIQGYEGDALHDTEILYDEV